MKWNKNGMQMSFIELKSIESAFKGNENENENEKVLFKDEIKLAK